MASSVNVVDEIKNHWTTKSTGALFLKLSNNQLLQLFFVKGELQLVKYQGKTGMDAVNRLSNLSILKSQFHKGAISRVTCELPKTNEVINILNQSVASDTPSDKPRFRINTEQRTVLEQVFIKYVGPIGDFIVSEEIATANSMSELVLELADQIDDIQDKANFKKEIKAALSKLS